MPTTNRILSNKIINISSELMKKSVAYFDDISVFSKMIN